MKLHFLLLFLAVILLVSCEKYPDPNPANYENWKYYTTENSVLTYNEINVIEIDDSNHVWIGTGDVGPHGASFLVVRNDTQWTNYNQDYFVDTYGKYFFYGEDRKGDLGRVIKSFAFGKDGTKYIGTGFGFIVWDGSANWTNYNSGNSDISDESIHEITFDPNGNIWVGTFVGISQFDGQHWTPYRYYEYEREFNLGVAYGLAIDEYGIVWAGGTNSVFTPYNSGPGLIRYVPPTNQYEEINKDLPSGYISEIKIDNKGIKWVGTHDGLVKIENEIYTVYTKKNSGLPGDFVTDLYIDNSGHIWIATDADGIAKFNGTDQWEVYNTSNSGILANKVNCIAVDYNETVWIGTEEGVSVFYP